MTRGNQRWESIVLCNSGGTVPSEALGRYSICVASEEQFFEAASSNPEAQLFANLADLHADRLVQPAVRLHGRKISLFIPESSIWDLGKRIDRLPEHHHLRLRGNTFWVETEGCLDSSLEMSRALVELKGKMAEMERRRSLADEHLQEAGPRKLPRVGDSYLRSIDRKIGKFIPLGLRAQLLKVWRAVNK